jgi:hypothetical protein
MIVSRLGNRYPDRFAAYAFVSISYWPSAEHFNVDIINEMTKQHLGYEELGFMYVFLTRIMTALC